MRVNFVLAGLARERFSAGHLIILEHAHELARRGHEVTLVPTIPSYRPDWYDVQIPLLDGPAFRPERGGLRAARSAGRWLRGGRRRRSDLADSFTEIVRPFASRSALPYEIASMTERLRDVVPPADVTLATGFATTLPVWLVGTGVKAYFMQHHEVVFAPESDAPEWTRAYAELSYRLPLNRIANCSWLRNEIVRVYGGQTPALCLNAIDLGRYFPDGAPPEGGPMTVVSYSGRRAPWKDLRTAAEAVRRARESVPDLRWLVYGDDALLAPDNHIAAYESVGFQDADGLRRLYSRAQVLLSASWYESFPLPPLEAMACGCAVLTTRLGTEDFARDGENARVVEAQDPSAMAQALVDLWRRPEERARLAEQGRLDAQAFTWKAAGDQLENVLLELTGGGERRAGAAVEPAAA